VDTAIQGEATAKNEFAAASRKIATLFDSHRDTTRSDYQRGKSEVTSKYETGQKKALKDHQEKIKPVDDCVGIADNYRQRLAFLAADYKKFKLSPDAPPPSRESYDKLNNPGDELFNRWPGWKRPSSSCKG